MRVSVLLQRTEFPENHYYVPDPVWRQSAFTVVRAGKAVTAPGYRIERAEYPGQDVLFCCSGRGFARSEGTTMEVGPNQVVWIANESPHAHWPHEADPWMLLWVRLDGPNCAAVRRKIVGSALACITLSGAAPIEAWFSRLFSVLRNRGPDIDLALNSLVSELLHLLYARGPRFRQTPLPTKLRAALAEMQSAPERAWPADDIAAAVGLSAAQTRRLFHQHLGLSPRQWLARERITRSQTLLLETDCKVSEVAEKCGYCDVYHFSREFRRRVGISPRTWRRAG